MKSTTSGSIITDGARKTLQRENFASRACENLTQEKKTQRTCPLCFSIKIRALSICSPFCSILYSLCRFSALFGRVQPDEKSCQQRRGISDANKDQNKCPRTHNRSSIQNRIVRSFLSITIIAYAVSDKTVRFLLTFPPNTGTLIIK